MHWEKNEPREELKADADNGFVEFQYSQLFVSSFKMFPIFVKLYLIIP